MNALWGYLPENAWLMKPASSRLPIHPTATPSEAEWVLLLEKPFAENSEEEKALLLKMLHAIHIELQDCIVVQEEAPELFASAKVVLIFGEGMRQVPGANRIVLPTLKQMLTTPSLKRTAWDRMKHLAS